MELDRDIRSGETQVIACDLASREKSGATCHAFIPDHAHPKELVRPVQRT